MTPPADTTPAHEAIRNLLGRYCELIDAGELDALAELFADAVLTDDAGTELGRGREGAARVYASVRIHERAGHPTK